MTEQRKTQLEWAWRLAGVLLMLVWAYATLRADERYLQIKNYDKDASRFEKRLDNIDIKLDRLLMQRHEK